MIRRELTLTWNTKTGALSAPLTGAYVMREENLRLLLNTDRELPDTAATFVTLKTEGDCDGDPLWQVTGFTRLASCKYEALAVVSSVGINTALGVGDAADKTSAPCALQARLEEGGVPTAKSDIVPLTLKNDYSRADDLTPAALPNADDWLDARAARIDKTLLLSAPQKTNFFGNTGAAKNADLAAEASTARAAENALATSITTKIPKVISPIDGHLAVLNSDGTLRDGGAVPTGRGAASGVTNDSSVLGATVQDALETLGALAASFEADIPTFTTLTMRAAAVTKIVPATPATLTIDCAQLAGSLSGTPSAIGFTVTIGSDSTGTQPVLFQKRYTSDGGSGYAGGLVYVNYNQASGEEFSFDTFIDSAASMAANFVAAIAAITTPPALGSITGGGVSDQVVLSSSTVSAAARLTVSENSGGYWPSANGSTSGSDEAGTREYELLAGESGKIPRVFAAEVLTYAGDPWTNYIGIFAKSLDGTAYRGPLWMTTGAISAGTLAPLQQGPEGIYFADSGDSLVVAACDGAGTRIDEATGTGAVVRALAFKEYE